MGICFKITMIVALIAWMFQAYPWMWWARYFSSVPPVSYDGRIQFNLVNLSTPESEDEIVSIVQNAYQNNRKIRVVGDGHSWSHIAQTQDMMISLSKYRGIVATDKQKMTVTVKAGTPLEQLSEELDKLGLGMINLGSVAGQSIAGAISTATHGTGLTVGNLAALVVKLRFVSGEGKVVTVTEDSNTELFRAAQVSIGMFGILSEVTLKVRSKFHLKELRTCQTLSYCLKNLDTLVQGDYKYVKMWIEFYNDFCVIYQTEETNDDIKPLPWWLGYFIYYIFAVSTRVTYLLPFTTPYAMWFVDHGFTNATQVDISYRIFTDFFDLPIHQEGEVIVNYNDSVRAVEAIRDLVIEHKLPVNYITEVRFVKGDDIYLSPQNGHYPGTCAITLTIYAPEYTALNYFDKVYATMREKGLNARFHWGKHFNHDHEEIQNLYPNFEEFADFRSQMDPNKVFVNEFLAEKFQFTKTKK